METYIYMGLAFVLGIWVWKLRYTLKDVTARDRFAQSLLKAYREEGVTDKRLFHEAFAEALRAAEIPDLLGEALGSDAGLRLEQLTPHELTKILASVLYRRAIATRKGAVLMAVQREPAQFETAHSGEFLQTPSPVSEASATLFPGSGFGLTQSVRPRLPAAWEMPQQATAAAPPAPPAHVPVTPETLLHSLELEAEQHDDFLPPSPFQDAPPSDPELLVGAGVADTTVELELPHGLRSRRR